MYSFPKDPKKIRATIKRYERDLKREKRITGHIDDGYGKRYLLGPLYMLMGDIDGAVESYQWFEENCPDDTGEPFQFLCWALALYKSGNEKDAMRKLFQTMLSNLYLIPYLLGEEQEEYDIWHASNLEAKDYLDYAPVEIFGLWDEEDRAWARNAYHSGLFTKHRERYIEIYHQLKTEPVGPKRSQLVKEAFAMSRLDLGEE